MPGFHIEHVALKYLINHKKGEGGAGPTPKSALEYWPLDLHVCAIVQGRNVLYHQETTRMMMGFLVFLLRQGFCKSQHHALT